MSTIITVLSIVVIGAITFFLNNKIKDKSRLRMILALSFFLYISIFIIIGIIKG